MHISFLLYEGMTSLDMIGPHEVLGHLPEVTIHRVAKQRGDIQDGLGLKLIADYALSEVSQTDILLIPGGGHATSLSKKPQLLDWIKQVHKSTQWTTSVCTGSLILGAAGLLQGKRATSHWAVLDRLPLWGATPISERMVRDGKIITAAGVSAGIDMALELAALIAGQDMAENLQLAIEYDPKPPFDAGSPAKAKPALREALRARLMERFEKAQG